MQIAAVCLLIRLSGATPAHLADCAGGEGTCTIFGAGGCANAGISGHLLDSAGSAGNGLMTNRYYSRGWWSVVFHVRWSRKPVVINSCSIWPLDTCVIPEQSLTLLSVSNIDCSCAESLVPVQHVVGISRYVVWSFSLLSLLSSPCQPCPQTPIPALYPDGRIHLPKRILAHEIRVPLVYPLHEYVGVRHAWIRE